jgi:predicted ArsR family transcriptional regulator
VDEVVDDVVDLSVRAARALADPTRHRLVELLAVSADPIGVSALTGALGVHHTVVRDHLRVLLDAGLVEEQLSRPAGRGRPPKVYVLAASAARQWPTTAHGYVELASMLAEAVRSGISAREAGRRAGRMSVAGTAEDAVRAITLDARRRGFRPSVEDDGEHVAVVLHACPYGEVAREDPATICGVHLGLAEGMADALGGVVVDGLRANDPDVAGCRLCLHRSG